MGVPAAQAINDVLALFIADEIVGFAVLYGVIAAMAGGTTGLVLTWLMHNASSEPEESGQTVAS